MAAERKNRMMDDLAFVHCLTAAAIALGLDGR